MIKRKVSRAKADEAEHRKYLRQNEEKGAI